MELALPSLSLNVSVSAIKDTGPTLVLDFVTQTFVITDTTPK